MLGGRQIAGLSAADAYQLIKPSLEIDWGGDPLGMAAGMDRIPAERTSVRI